MHPAVAQKPTLATRGSGAHYPGRQALPEGPEVHANMPSGEGLEITGAAWEGRSHPGSTNRTGQCHRAGMAKPEAREGWAGGRASFPPKSMSLLTWAEENLTALETCPLNEEGEAQGCRRSPLPVGTWWRALSAQLLLRPKRLGAAVGLPSPSCLMMLLPLCDPS